MQDTAGFDRSAYRPLPTNTISGDDSKESVDNLNQDQGLSAAVIVWRALRVSSLEGEKLSRLCCFLGDSVDIHSASFIYERFFRLFATIIHRIGVTSRKGRFLPQPAFVQVLKTFTTTTRLVDGSEELQANDAGRPLGCPRYLFHIVHPDSLGRPPLERRGVLFIAHTQGPLPRRGRAHNHRLAARFVHPVARGGVALLESHQGRVCAVSVA